MNEQALSLLHDATNKQRMAADPTVSAWVRANAGTGKTHVLTQRILRLLLSGADPRSILCLTFTKNAAAEMEARVLQHLGEWCTADDIDLETRLATLLGRPATGVELTQARCLFAEVIDAPGGLAMMTIHSFCERVLRRFSLEANVPPQFDVLTDEDTREIILHAKAVALSQSQEELHHLIEYVDDNGFSSLLNDLMFQRNAFVHLFELANAEPLAFYERKLRDCFSLHENDTQETLLSQAVSIIDTDRVRDVAGLLLQSSTRDKECAQALNAFLAANSDAARFETLRSVCFTKERKKRQSLVTSTFASLHPQQAQWLTEVQTQFLSIHDKACAAAVVKVSCALFRVFWRTLNAYEKEKRNRSSLDFEDLIQKTLNLLTQPGTSEWVLYQLDQRIDHILIDEAQDTTPAQWHIVEALTADFFAGQGARNGIATLFCVGDDKQSIYGFQGAAPELLAANGSAYESRVNGANLEWRNVDLNVSFRSLPPVLEVVDLVLQSLPHPSQTGRVLHLPKRKDEGGCVEFWEPEYAEKQKNLNVYERDDESQVTSPNAILAERIAGQIANWIENKVFVPSTGCPISPGDILILLRKRDPMAKILQAALMRKDVPVAGIDRVALLDTIAVADLLALTDVLLQPYDDLSLAVVLKSPLFGISEDDLYELAFDRVGSLWSAVCEKSKPISSRLQRWQELATTAKPFEFFSQILEVEGFRKNFLQRLGEECHDILDELLVQAETYQARGGYDITGFVSYLRQSGAEVKREASQATEAVRIMTVHGAKGLEAPIVILADACRPPKVETSPLIFLEESRLPVWAIKAASYLPSVENAKSMRKRAHSYEDDRLLYVAMTRARDRLYVAGSYHRKNLHQSCWYEKINRASANHLMECCSFDGRKAWRVGQTHTQHKPTKRTLSQKASLPAFLRKKVSAERRSTFVAPSDLYFNQSKRKARIEKTISCPDLREQGKVIHRILEILPTISQNHHSDFFGMISRNFHSNNLTAQEKNSIDHAFITLKSFIASNFIANLGFAESALALEIDDTNSRTVIIGQVDRLFFSPNDVTVFDFKTGISGLFDEHQTKYDAQLSAYGFILQRIFPNRKVQAFVLQSPQRKIIKIDQDFEEILMAALRKYQA